jgi:hypothetical protein
MIASTGEMLSVEETEVTEEHLDISLVADKNDTVVFGAFDCEDSCAVKPRDSLGGRGRAQVGDE